MASRVQSTTGPPLSNSTALKKHLYIIFILTVTFLLSSSCVQAFIQALLSTAIFLQRFSFFTTCLAQQLCGVAPWQTPKGKFFKFGSSDCWKMHFLGIFLEFQSSMGSFEEKLTAKIHVTFLYMPFYSIQMKSKKNRRIELKIFQGCFKNKNEQKHMKKLSFITQFKIKFLLPFTGLRKVFGKMPVCAILFSLYLLYIIY